METFPPAAVRRARWAVAVVFFVNGAIFGSWAPHIPIVQERLGLGTGLLGTALLAIAAGALVTMVLGGALMARIGSAWPTRIAALALCTAFPLAALAPSLGALIAAFLFFGAANGIMDVAMNAHGVAVERRLGRPVMSSYHGMFSLGGLVGAGAGAVLLDHLAPATHVLLASVVLATLALPALLHLLPGRADAGESGAAFALPSRTTLGLGALCFLSMLSEGAVLDWSAAYLRQDLGVSPGLAATGFAAFSAAMTAARFGGDHLRRRLGAVALVRGSVLLAGGGLGLALLIHTPLASVVGFACTGLGLANAVPVLFGAAGRLPGQLPATAIAAVATTGYLGFLAGPPLIGIVAQGTSLRLGLGVLVAACALVAIFARAARWGDLPEAPPSGSPPVLGAEPGRQPSAMATHAK